LDKSIVLGTEFDSGAHLPRVPSLLILLAPHSSGDHIVNHSAASDPHQIHYRTVHVKGVDVFYREAGSPESPSILLLHGFPTSSHMFRDLIPLLAGQFHLIAPDYPGFGYSSRPEPAAFEYTFEHLTDVISAFTEAVGLPFFSLYAQDFGGPVGFRLATRRPNQVRALLIQNANAYDEGITEYVSDFVLKIYRHRTPEAEAQLRALFELPATKRQYLEGVSDPSLVSPDAWEHAQWGMDRPGNKSIQFVLHANYGSNLELYPEWHDYFRRYQPPALITWGKHDPVFSVGGAHAYRKDLKSVELHLLDTGHFALETHAVEIAQRISEFLPRHL
jgi:pimeloyl-ACP methyl ester carboxylesterase